MKMTKINTMCLTCAKYGVECKGTTDQTYTGCVRRTPLTGKAQALQMYKYTKSVWKENKTDENWRLFCKAKTTCRLLGVII